MAERVRLGIVGLGEVVQTIHLPLLAKLTNLFEVCALCDPSAEARRVVGELWHVDRSFSSYREMIELGDLEAVLIASPNAFHAETALVAMKAGKHVLIEKPACVTPSEADLLVKQESQSGVVVQVGYMRLHASNVAALRDALRDRVEVRMVKINDVIGRNRLIIDQVREVTRAADIREADLNFGQELRARQMLEIHGSVQIPALVRAHDLLIGLASHDVSTMRALFGAPKGIAYASQYCHGNYLNITFDYDTYNCQLAVAVDQIPRYDTYVEVYTDRVQWRIDFDTPYVSHLPHRITELRADGDRGFGRRVSQRDWGDPFEAQWRGFHASVREGGRVLTSLADACEDIRLLAAAIELMRPSQHQQEHR